MFKYSILLVALAAHIDPSQGESFLRRRLSPIAGCGAQANCLSITGDGLNGDDACDADGKRTVCMNWNNDGGSCVKDTADTVSHACPVVDGVFNSAANVKTESWDDGDVICVTVSGGETAVFGVKDGAGCSGPGDFAINGGDRGICSGPMTACDGGNKVECAWSFPTADCSATIADDDTTTNGDDTTHTGGGRTCFSSRETVQMESGEMKFFKDLKIGDSILSANRNGEMSYSKVIFLPHGENDTPTNFVAIKTKSGRSIKMTRRHLLPTCSGELVVAQDVKRDTCLRTVDGEELVANTRTVEVKGIYTAVTENEFLVVNGVIASPFASPDGVKHAIFNQTDVDAWCTSNNWLVYEHEHNVQLEKNAPKQPSEDCETMLEKLYANYKDEPIGWGTNSWGYAGWKNPSSRPQHEKSV